MQPLIKKILLGLSVCTLGIGGLARLDRFFFKHNDSFCIRYVQSTLSYNPDWEVERLSPKEKKQIEKILNQEFIYFAKGGQSYAFESRDGNYVLKLIRFPSSLRPLSWMSHTFSRYKNYRIEDAKRSSKKLHNAFHSFKLAYEELREESGLVYIHLNPSQEIDKTVTLIDKTGAHYQIPLGKITFILQKKAQLIYPSLDRCKAAGDVERARQAVAKLIALVISCSKKGIVDYDAILRKNYGFTQERAIHIDLGEFGRDESVKEGKKLKEHVLEMTGSFKKRLEKFYPEFLFLYEEELNKQL